MSSSLRLSEELEHDLQLLAEKHERSLHGEMIYALKQYVSHYLVPYEVDTLFSREKEVGLWDVYDVYREGEHSPIARVQADSGNHACEWIHRTRWITRLLLSAQPAEKIGITWGIPQQ